MSRTAMLAAGAFLLAGAATAQQSVQLKKIDGFQEPIHAGTYHVASGQFIPAQPGQISVMRGSTDVVFNNNHYTGWFYDINGGTFVVDEGRVPSTTSPVSASAPVSVTGVANSYRIESIQIAYATDSDGPGTARLGIYDSYATCSNPLGSLTPTLDLIINGLPGTISSGSLTPYTFDIDMTGFEFCMAADGDGVYDDGESDRFGYALLMSADMGSQIGPISGARPGAFAPTGNGTVFQAPGAASGTGIGAVDHWFNLSGMGPQCLNAGGYDPIDGDPAFGNFWLVLGADLAQDCTGCSNGVSGIDDSYENNDDCGSAAPLAAPGLYSPLVAKKRAVDSDFYSLTLAPNTGLTATALFSDAQADIDMRLFEAGCGTQLDISQSTSDNEDVGYFNCTAAPIDLVVEVYVWDFAASDCGDYMLDLAIDTSCVDDALEDNDSCIETFQLAEGLSINLTILDCDLDYYDITLKNGESLDITMATNPAEADLDMYLFLDDATCDTGGGVLTQAFTTNAIENIQWTNTTGQTQTYILRIDVFSLEPGFNCTGYTLDYVNDTGTELGTKFCSAELNSTGQGAHVFATGSDVVADNMFFLNCEFLPMNSFGYFINSRTQIFLGNPGGSQGNICVAGSPIGRFNNQVVNTGAGSTVQIQADLTNWPQPSGFISVIPGDTWNCQYWYRDANPMPTSNFSDAVSVMFQ